MAPALALTAIRKTREQDSDKATTHCRGQATGNVRPTARDQRARLTTILKANPSSDTDTQQRRMVEALEGGSVTTLEAMRYLDVINRDPESDRFAVRVT